MKTAISIPDGLYRDAERMAAQLRRSRSRLYADALREYLARHGSGAITDALNRVADDVAPQRDPFTAAAAAGLLKRVEW